MESSESVITDCTVRALSLNWSPIRYARRMLVDRTAPSTSVPRIAIAESTGSISRATAAVTSATTTVTAPVSISPRAYPERSAPLATTAMMSLRRRSRTKLHRAARTASKARVRRWLATDSSRTSALIVLARWMRAWIAVSSTTPPSRTGSGTPLRSMLPRRGTS